MLKFIVKVVLLKVA